MAQAWPAPKPKLTQEDFDESVNTNVEDFDMTPEEAIKSAVEEFELQGYDLSNIVKSRGLDLATHPVALASNGVMAACSKGSIGQLDAALAALSDSLKAFTENMQEAYVIAHKASTMSHLMAACPLVAEGSLDAASSASLVEALNLMKQLMVWVEIRDAFTNNKGPELMLDLLQRTSDSAQVQAAVAAVAEAACFKAEDAKCRFMDLGFIGMLLDKLKAPDVDLELIAPASGTVRSVVTADDDRPAGSKAFMHARLLGKTHSAIKVLLGLMRRVAAAQRPDVLAALLSSVRMLAANEEICKEFSDDGGIHACLDVLRSHMSSKDVVRSSLLALRQLANSDGVKRSLAAHGGIEILLSVLSVHGGGPDGEEVVEAAVGLLANMTLRQPEIAHQASDAGVADVLIELMQERIAWGMVMRQCCLLLRNMVVRTPELRPSFLEKGAEDLLRAIKARHPSKCKDVGYAALRDLGLDNYND